MCFEFEALYWAKLAEEQERKKQAEQQKQEAHPAPAGTEDQQEPVPA